METNEKLIIKIKNKTFEYNTEYMYPDMIKTDIIDNLAYITINRKFKSIDLCESITEEVSSRLGKYMNTLENKRQKATITYTKKDGTPKEINCTTYIINRNILKFIAIIDK